MSRVLSLLLIPLVLVNQGLCCVHSHLGTELAEPGDHAARPHIHLSTGSGHSHSHRHTDAAHPHRHTEVAAAEGEAAVDAAFPAVGPGELPGHDSTAIFLGERQSVLSTRAKSIDRSALLLAAIDSGVVSDIHLRMAASLVQAATLLPPFLSAEIPIYLRLACIRC